jgi:hypothetical protein
LPFQKEFGRSVNGGGINGRALDFENLKVEDSNSFRGLFYKTFNGRNEFHRCLSLSGTLDICGKAGAYPGGTSYGAALLKVGS